MVKRCATLAQLVERGFRKAEVAGSIPAGGSIASELTTASINYVRLLSRGGRGVYDYAGIV